MSLSRGTVPNPSTPGLIGQLTRLSKVIAPEWSETPNIESIHDSMAPGTPQTGLPLACGFRIQTACR